MNQPRLRLTTNSRTTQDRTDSSSEMTWNPPPPRAQQQHAYTDLGIHVLIGIQKADHKPEAGPPEVVKLCTGSRVMENESV